MTLIDRAQLVAANYEINSAFNLNDVMLETIISPESYQSTIFNTHNSLAEEDDDIIPESTPPQHPSNETSSLIAIIGNGIQNNKGVLLSQINKIPSYSSGFRHQHHNNNNHNNNNSNNEHHHQHQAKDSISTLPPGTTNQPLTSLLIRLPITGDSSLKSNNQRSLINGLPHYYLPSVENTIHSCKSLDNIEYLHGDVISNQYLNNKRILRNYQWKMYWDYKIGGQNGILRNSKRILSKCKKGRTLLAYERELLLHKEKMIEFNREANSIKMKKDKLISIKESIENQIHNNVNNDDTNDDNENLKGKINELEISINKLNNINLPQFEDEIEFKDFEVEPTPLSTNEILNYRFQSPFSPNYSNLINKSHVIIEREFQVNDPQLQQYQYQLFGGQKAHQFQSDIQNSNGTISTNIVRFKRIPNSNQLGFGNIKGQKPSFLQ